MPISKEAAVVRLHDAKIAQLTADVTTNPTYGSLVDLGGVIEMKLTGEIDYRELEGDNVILASNAFLKAVDIDVQQARITLDALAIIMGGSVTASGMTPNQKQTYTILGTDETNYFKIEGQSKGTDAAGGDVKDCHVVLYKCRLSGAVDYTLGADYAKVSFKARAIPTISNSKIKDVVFNETAATIA